MLLVAPAMWADATLRYHTDIQLANGTAVAALAYQALTENRRHRPRSILTLR